MKKIKLVSALILLLNLCFLNAKSQESANEDTLPRVIEQIQSDLSLLKKLKISGYIQAQAVFSDSSGISQKDANGNSNSMDKNFQLRRGRIKFAYAGNSLSQYVMQFDVTENGFKTKDIYAKITDPFCKTFTLTTGIFNRPWGYEIEFSSSMRESPERSRASTTLFPNERDLGAMLTIQAPKTSKWNFLKLDMAVVTGNSVSGAESDKYKDLISRLNFSKSFLDEKLKISGDLSYYYGGPSNGTAKNYKVWDNNGTMIMAPLDVSKGTRVKRELKGADIQVTYDNPIGLTTLRGEVYAGQQPGIAGSSASQIAAVTTDAYVRFVQGYYVYFVQNFLNRNQFILKYDVYDPNTKVSGDQIIAANGFTKADAQYKTFGIGYAVRLDENTKFTVYYDNITNESTKIAGFTKNLKDNLLTLRLQYKF